MDTISFITKGKGRRRAAESSNVGGTVADNGKKDSSLDLN